MVRISTKALVIGHAIALIVLVFYVYELVQACIATAKAAALQAAAWSSNSQVTGGDPVTAAAAAGIWPANKVAVAMLGVQSNTQGPVEQAVAAAQDFNYPGGSFTPIPAGNGWTLASATKGESTTAGEIVSGAETLIALL